MVEVKGGRGKYIEAFFIFGCGEFIYFLALGMFVGATSSQTLIRKDWLNNARVYAARDELARRPPRSAVVNVYAIDRKGKDGSVAGA